MSIEMTDADAKKMATNTISINSKLLYLCIILGIIQTIMMNDDKMVWISVYVSLFVLLKIVKRKLKWMIYIISFNTDIPVDMYLKR